ncbi:hypothetical protein Scep_011477 [Stephania cephalantha]|uniref:Homeobox domain-containing protein n=1 Tax=Stephania cephalantha TaxID=152367 RepID=A0AAP0P6I4_9MAGN
MASSNRHWPSMFKSKPCNTHHHQWQHDINPSSLMSSTCQRSSFNSSSGVGGGGVSGEERSPEPKPRWNPKPEQIRILEAIFNSGMVNPPRDEIRKIRAQLQEYGQVGDANVFYWFQNRKSRSKHKQKHHHHNLQSQHKTQLLSSSSLVSITNTASTVAHTSLAPLHQTSSSSSSSSSESKTSPKGTTHDHHENKNITSSSTSASLLGSLMSSMSSSGGGNSFFNVSHDVSNSPLHQTSSSSHHAGFLSSSSSSTSHLHEQFFFPTSTATSTSGVQNNFAVFPHHGLGFSAPTDPSSLDVLHHDHQVISSGPSHGLLLSEFLMMNHQSGSKRILDRQDHDHQLLMMNYSSIDANTCTATTTNDHNASMLSPTPTATATTTHARFDVNPIQGVALMGAPADAPRLTVFINDVAFEVSVGPFNVREAFGDDALLIHSSGQPVLTNEWGVTLQSLQPGASYYLVI